MTILDWLIVFVLNGSVIVWGFLLSRKTHTSEDWFLGHRTLPWWTVGLSMFATNVDNADLVSLTGTTYREGLHIIMVHTLGAVTGVGFAAFCLVPRMARAGHYTNAEYLEARFGPATRVLSAVIQIQYRSSMLGLMIWSVYLLLTGFLGLSSLVAWSLLVGLVALAAVYTSLGGLKSVVFTDALQGGIMFLGMAAILASVWTAAGGWTAAIDVLRQQTLADERTAADLARMSRFFGDDGRTSPLVIAVGWLIIAGGYWSVNHSQTMRLAGARSIWDMKMAAVLGAVISMPMMVGCATLGVFGRALFPEYAEPDRLYPHMANLFLGVGLKGLVVAGIVAAAVSTFDSLGSSLSALFTRDIYARLISGDRSDAHYVRVSRCATVVILALGFAYLPFIRSRDTMLQAFLTLIPVFVTPLFTMYLIGVFTRAPRSAGLAGIAAGSLYGLAALTDREIADVSWLAWWFTNRWVALIWSMVWTACGAGLATDFRGTEPAVDRPDSTRGWLQSSSLSLGALPDHPFASPPPRWLSPELLWAVAFVLTLTTLLLLFW